MHAITVIGAGTMGNGIAQVAAQAGYRTVMYDVDAARTGAGLDKIRANLAKGVEKGKFTQAQVDETVSRISVSSDMELAARDADMVIEAVPERLDLKREVFSRLDHSTRPTCIFATNTSSLSVAALAQTIRGPERFIGMHFFNPVHIMELLEIVVAPHTGEATLVVAQETAAAMGKTAIVVKDSPGFASSRLGVVLGLEAMRMLEQGVASAADIDKAMELGYRHPMGPLKLTDLVGLDVRLGIAEYLHRELKSEAFSPPKILRDKVAAGKLGKKSGEGFYTW